MRRLLSVLMTNAFIELPEDASLDTICGQAGRMFAARKANNPQTDFNTEIWYLAGDAMSAGFSALRGMTKEQVARAMGDSISRHVNSFSPLPKDASLDTICGQAGKIFAARKANNPQTDFNTEIWYLAGDAMIAGFSALGGMTKEQVARAMG